MLRTPKGTIYKRDHLFRTDHLYTHIYLYIYIYRERESVLGYITRDPIKGPYLAP